MKIVMLSLIVYRKSNFFVRKIFENTPIILLNTLLVHILLMQYAWKYNTIIAIIQNYI